MTVPQVGVASPRITPIARNERLMETAVELAKDGEIGNSDAIALLEMPHHPEDLRAILHRFDAQLTREARGKLSLAAFVPRPDAVANQRYEPIFDRYPISGKTYTTASGTVTLNEVQYYNGEMLQVFGDCTNVGAVRETLAGSGYRPMTLNYSDGRQAAIAQFWAHNLSDTSLRPYNAVFVIVVAVPEGCRAQDGFLKANDNEPASVLSMLRGTFNPAMATYENSARLFYVRLLDSTRVAIEVGRERMGTDKRPGTITLTHAGREVAFRVTDDSGHPVANLDVVLADDGRAYRREVAKAAATAGIAGDPFPSGTEYVYPSVARIGNGPVVSWQWRTDVQPRLQPALPDNVRFDASSEEGAMFMRWGFRPQVLGYIPNVRGVVTGVPETAPLSGRVRIKNARTVVVLSPRR